MFVCRKEVTESSITGSRRRVTENYSDGGRRLVTERYYSSSQKRVTDIVSVLLGGNYLQRVTVLVVKED